MKKTFLLLAGFMLLSMPAWSDQLELGIGAAPAPSGTEDPNAPAESLTLLRVAYTTLGIINFSLDSLILPPSSIQQMTGQFTFDPITYETSFVQGIYRPGMVNLYDVGIKFALFNKLVMGVQVGVNSLYIYRMNEDPELFNGINTELGANIKLSAGWKFGNNLGLEAAMYSIQPSIDDATNVLKGLASDNTVVQDAAIDQLLNNAAIGALIVLYL